MCSGSAVAAIPTHDTVSTVMHMIDPKSLDAAYGEIHDILDGVLATIAAACAALSPCAALAMGREAG